VSVTSHRAGVFLTDNHMKSRSPREFSWRSSLDCAGVPKLAGDARDLWDGAPVIKFKEHLDKPSSRRMT
jgi:hypothetical protein